ncbi:MAG: tetratricopeptide repeat protein [Bacteroidales bacterium]|nr:tetratricopeptide repeat protein [Bacteroidales bacterium]
MKKIAIALLTISINILIISNIDAQTYTKQAISIQDSAAIKKYTENYELYLSKSDLRNASDFLNQIAEIYWNRNHFETSAEYYQKSLILNRKLGNENGMAGINSNLGMIYSDIGDYQKSMDHLLQAVAARRNEKNTATGRENLFNTLLNLSSSLKQLGRYDEAIKYLEEALSYAQEINNLEKISIFYLQLAEVHEKAGHDEESKKFAEKYMTFYKTMKDEQVFKSRMGMENERLRAERIALEKKLKEMELQEKTVELKKKDLEVKEYHSKADSLANTLSKAQLAAQVLAEQAKRERLEQERNNVIFVAILFVVILIAFILFYAFRQKRKANIALANKNKEILMQQEEIIMQRDKLDSSNKELDRKNHQIMESINYAKLIQTAMLQPEQSLDKHVPDSFILFKPKNVVSGDFYWYTKQKDKLIIAAIDCTGHGVPGAFMSMIGANILNQIILNDKKTEPDIILEELHVGVTNALNQKHTGNDDGMDASLFVIDKKKKSISFAGARNPLIIIKDGVLEEIDGDDMSIGGFQHLRDEKFTKKEIKIEGDAYLYSFSDGYPDQFGGKLSRKFMHSRMRDLLLEIHQKNMDEQKEILDDTIEQWRMEGEDKQTDDILVIGMHIQF